MPKPKHYTAEEERQMILDHMRALCAYWSDPELPRGKDINDTEYNRMEGLCFSILTMLDGCVGSMPAIDLRMAPHPDDKDYCINRGERWHKPGLLINDVALHDMWYVKKS